MEEGQDRQGGEEVVEASGTAQGITQSQGSEASVFTLIFSTKSNGRAKTDCKSFSVECF